MILLLSKVFASKAYSHYDDSIRTMSIYFRPAVTVDLLVLDWSQQRLSLLLIQRAHAPFAGYWALPGGFIEEQETLEASARRELWEETGLRVSALQSFGIYGDPGRDPRGRTLTIAYLALTSGQPAICGRDDAVQARWFPVQALPDLAFDHVRIVSDGLNCLRHQLLNTFPGEKLPLPAEAAAHIPALLAAMG